jgi:hypothetical protein
MRRGGQFVGAEIRKNAGLANAVAGDRALRRVGLVRGAVRPERNPHLVRPLAQQSFNGVTHQLLHKNSTLGEDGRRRLIIVIGEKQRRLKSVGRKGRLFSQNRLKRTTRIWRPQGKYAAAARPVRGAEIILLDNRRQYITMKPNLKNQTLEATSWRARGPKN